MFAQQRLCSSQDNALHAWGKGERSHGNIEYLFLLPSPSRLTATATSIPTDDLAHTKAGFHLQPQDEQKQQAPTMYTHAHARTHACTHAQTHARKRQHTRTSTHMHTLTRTCPHAHMHALSAGTRYQHTPYCRVRRQGSAIAPPVCTWPLPPTHCPPRRWVCAGSADR